MEYYRISDVALDPQHKKTIFRGMVWNLSIRAPTEVL
uniref:Uncharacterized protein n=1 Tax=Arundo donax TaxID=35708 RepID=A0A0A9A3J9_ARUDO